MKKIKFILLSLMFLLFFFLLFSNNAYAVEVSNFEELEKEIAKEGEKIDISLNSDFEFTSKIDISNKEVSINGNGHTISRNKDYTEGLFSISEDAILTLNNLNIDGKSSDWFLDFDNQEYVGQYMRVPVTVGDTVISATESLITNKGNLSIIKSEIKNNVSSVRGTVVTNYNYIYLEESNISNNLLNVNNFGGVAIYSVDNSTVIVNNSKFVNNVSGNKGGSSGGAISIINGELLKIYNNSLFEENFAQSNGGAVYAQGTKLEVRDSSFSKNGVGNDSGVFCLHSSKNIDGKEVIFDNNIFHDNYGLSLKGQSMGSVIGTEGDIDASYSININKCEFYNNKAAVGVIANHGGTSDNIKINVDNCNFHDNFNSVFLIQNSDVYIKNSIIKNNTSSIFASVAYILFSSEMIIENTEITENTSNRNDASGSAIMINGDLKNGEITKVILKKGTKIHNNTGVRGGAVYINANASDANAALIMEEGSAIYNNHALKDGDDIVVVCEDEKYDKVSLELVAAKDMGIFNIDNWYYDNEGARFDATENCVVYDKNKNEKILALKATGIFKLVYNTNGGNNLIATNDLILKTGEEKNITEEIAVKEGYEFLFWNTKIDGTGLTVMPGELYNGADGYVLYAQYKKIGDSEEQDIENKEAQKVKVDDTDKTNNNKFVIIGSVFMIIGTGVIIYGQKKRKKRA